MGFKLGLESVGVWVPELWLGLDFLFVGTWGAAGVNSES